MEEEGSEADIFVSDAARMECDEAGDEADQAVSWFLLLILDSFCRHGELDPLFDWAPGKLSWSGQ